MWLGIGTGVFAIKNFNSLQEMWLKDLYHKKIALSFRNIAESKYFQLRKRHSYCFLTNVLSVMEFHPLQLQVQ